jgi:hypothetical protein
MNSNSETFNHAGNEQIVDSEFEVSIVMPCLNEARTVGRCVQTAMSALFVNGIKGEVVVADNNSDDNSRLLAQEQGARVVIALCRGYGNALQAGIVAARGQFVVMADSDESCDFSEIRLFVERLRAGDELVMGNRFKGGIRPGAMPWLHRYLGNPLLTGILNLFFRTRIGDAHCGVRAFRKDAYLRLSMNSQGMEFASEMLVKAALQKQRISEIPVVLHRDGRNGPPHLRSFPDGWRHLRFLLLMCPLWLYLIPSSLMTGSGLLLMTWLTPGPQAFDNIVLDIHSMLLGSLLVILGIQTLWLGTFAKIHACTADLLPMDKLTLRILQSASLEWGLLIGTAVLMAGMSINTWLCCSWWGQDFGPLDVSFTMRIALWGSTLIILGVQAIYGSFFLSLLRMTQSFKYSFNGQ